jgi:hypothetical protein
VWGGDDWHGEADGGDSPHQFGGAFGIRARVFVPRTGEGVTSEDGGGELRCPTEKICAEHGPQLDFDG